MLSDRRPILLANARIVDPSRDLDFPGDLLIADGVIRDAKRGIGAAGVGNSIGLIGLSAGIAALPVSIVIGVVGGLVWWGIKKLAEDD